MLAFPHSVRIYVAVEPVDMRKQYDGLLAAAQTQLSGQRHGHNPHDYLLDVLGRLPAMTTADDLRPLLPAQWKPEPAS